MSELPQYTGPLTPCQKCGTIDARTEYRRPLGVVDNSWPWDECRDEHLRRTCKTCGYQWNERALDAEA